MRRAEDNRTGCKELGAALKEARSLTRSDKYLWRCKSAADVAEELKISRSALTAYENGLKAVPASLLRDIESLYGVSFENVERFRVLHHMGDHVRSKGGPVTFQPALV